MTPTNDRIEKQVLLNAPRSRVWRALTDAAEFGAWFGVRLAGELRPGARVAGRITSPGYEHLNLVMLVERVEPERLFSYRWHPNAVDAGRDYSGEPTTLVEFTLEEIDAEHTRLSIVESGFDALPPGRRDEAFRSNDHGWTIQGGRLERHVAAHAQA